MSVSSTRFFGLKVVCSVQHNRQCLRIIAPLSKADEELGEEIVELGSITARLRLEYRPIQQTYSSLG